MATFWSVVIGFSCAVVGGSFYSIFPDHRWACIFIAVGVASTLGALRAGIEADRKRK
jgi:hypothetical protein